MRRSGGENYSVAKKVREDNVDIRHAMADALMKYETIDREQIDDVMNGRPPRPPQDYDRPTGSAPSGEGDATDGSPSSDGAGNVGKPASEH